MMFIYFFLLSYSLVILSRLDGPFDIIHKTKLKLFETKYGGFFYKLFECPYCLGFWTSIISYLVFFPISLYIVPFALISAFLIYVGENLLSAIQVV